MVDLSWLSEQAKAVHDLFLHAFYGIATVMIVLGVVIEFFKIPLGNSGDVTQLIGRTLVAAILLITYTDVSNAIASFADALAAELGDLNQIKLVLSKFGEKWDSLSLSWASFKDVAIMIVSYILFFLLYTSVFLADAGIIFGWTILYVFSPLLIVLFILPATAQATKTLYRSLFEISAWKIVWSVLATLLWSFALSAINQPESKTSFVTVLALNLILAASLLLTPKVVHALMNAGIAGLASEVGGVTAAAAMLSPGLRMATAAKAGESAVKRFAAKKASGMSKKLFAKSASGRNEDGRKNQNARAQPAEVNSREAAPPEWVTRAPPNTEEAPPWMQARLDKERAWDSKNKNKDKK